MKYKKPKNKSKHHIEPGLAYMKITIYSGSIIDYDYIGNSKIFYHQKYKQPKNKGYAL